MTHIMHLKSRWFELMKNREKKVELRLNDEKRRALKEGDEIEFVCDYDGSKFWAKIKKLEKYDSFESFFNEKSAGVLEMRTETYLFMKHAASLIYDTDQVEKYGVLAIYFEILKIQIQEKDKHDYKLPQGISTFDICLCTANCKTPCGRKGEPEEEMYSYSDLSQHCLSFVAKDEKD